jgi:hypothetical protein
VRARLSGVAHTSPNWRLGSLSCRTISPSNLESMAFLPVEVRIEGDCSEPPDTLGGGDASWSTLRSSSGSSSASSVASDIATAFYNAPKKCQVTVGHRLGDEDARQEDCKMPSPPLFGLQVLINVVFLSSHQAWWQMLAGVDPMLVALGVSVTFMVVLYGIAMVINNPTSVGDPIIDVLLPQQFSEAVGVDEKLHQKRLEYLRAAKKLRTPNEDAVETPAEPESREKLANRSPNELPSFESNSSGAEVWCSMTQSRYCTPEILALVAQADLSGATRQARKCTVYHPPVTPFRALLIIPSRLGLDYPRNEA